MVGRWMWGVGVGALAMALLVGLLLVGCPSGAITPPPNGGNGGATTGTVHGTVVNSDSTQPVRNAMVYLQSDPSRTVLTDSTGAFTIDEIPFGEAQSVVAQSLAYGQGTSESFVLTEEAAELTLDPILLQSTGPPGPPGI